MKPLLSIVVDTEEGFDWSSPVRGTPYTLASCACLHRVADLARRLGATFTSVVTYPVADDDEAWAAVADAAAAGAFVVGAHTHAWVTPPFGEAATVANSYQSNLPPELERAKVAALADRLAARTGARPTIFKAGRSGVGAASPGILAAEGFAIDLSYMPHFNYGANGGPSFLDASPEPFFFPEGAPGAGLLEIPDTSGFLGALRGSSRTLFPMVDRPRMHAAHVPGALARGGLLNRVPLTPEGVTLPEAKDLTKLLRAGGLVYFQLSFHSTSLVPGETSYTSSEADVVRLLDWLEAYVAFFRAELGGEVATPHDILARMRATEAGQRPMA